MAKTGSTRSEIYGFQPIFFRYLSANAEFFVDNTFSGPFLLKKK